ncbi:MAG: NADH-quinone oxidoreductase subunit H [Candidatus Omnitrophota bacterium]
MIKMPVFILHLAVFVAAAPLVSGLITKMKNNIRMRIGQSVLQPYYNMAKLFSKGEVISETASWIFRAVPFVTLSSSLAAAALILSFVFSGSGIAGDLLALIFIFSLGRFFLALAALDAGSSFGGMGSSREMFISSLAEPALLLAAFSISLQFGSTDIAAFGGIHDVTVSSYIAGAVLFLVTIAETSRIPVDNQETHLELTMVHEAMVLEYSGRSLALIEMASYIKQMVLFFLIAQIVFPAGAPAGADMMHGILWALWYPLRIFIVAAMVALAEVSVAKMRLFRAADFLGFAFALAVVSVVCAVLGA